MVNKAMSALVAWEVACVDTVLDRAVATRHAHWAGIPVGTPPQRFLSRANVSSVSRTRFAITSATGRTADIRPTI